MVRKLSYSWNGTTVFSSLPTPPSPLELRPFTLAHVFCRLCKLAVALEETGTRSHRVRVSFLTCCAVSSDPHGAPDSCDTKPMSSGQGSRLPPKWHSLRTHHKLLRAPVCVVGTLAVPASWVTKKLLEYSVYDKWFVLQFLSGSDSILLFYQISSFFFLLSFFSSFLFPSLLPSFFSLLPFSSLPLSLPSCLSVFLSYLSW